jgi:hypothetical protein
MSSLLKVTIASLVALWSAIPSLVFAAQDWPLYSAPWTIHIEKDPAAVPAPFEPDDIHWLHFHRNHPTLPNASSNTIVAKFRRGYEERDPAVSNVLLRYVIHGVPVSDWLQPPFRHSLAIDHPALAQLQDGVHDLSIEVQGSARDQYKPIRAFLHLTRDKTQGEPFGFNQLVPAITDHPNESNTDPHFGPGLFYLNPSAKRWIGYPVEPNLVPWHNPLDQEDLYLELMAPHSELFHGVQMWWDHPAHPGFPFLRAFPPKHGEDHRSLRIGEKHERFPMKDGARGIGWMSPYISGQVDSLGRFAFAEVGGRVGYLMPDGEIITVAGWRVKPGKDPIWFLKPTATIRQNMENRGTWVSGRGEFHTPLDIAIDPNDERIWYVAAYEDHVIWKVEVPADPKTGVARISVFAGDPTHQPGFQNGLGTVARFNGPSSLVFDPIRDVLYVADQDNDAIRQIDRAGNVTTVAGQSGMRQRLTNRGVLWTDQLASRAATQFAVSAVQAASGIKPDIYLPQTIRVDSFGRIVLLEIGYGAIRRINPLTGETALLGEVRQKHREFDRGWAWMDVDRWGNAGPKDGIYWCKFVSTIPGELFNEAYGWVPPNGGTSMPLFTAETGLYPDGWGRRTQANAPHYPWLVAVDPRGALLVAGGGEHGVSRLRKRRVDDPEPTANFWLGRPIWASGSPNDQPVASASFAFKFGWGGHNYIGLPDAWGLKGASDDELLTVFEAPPAVRANATAKAHWLEFIRPHTQSGINLGSPVDRTAPAIPSRFRLLRLQPQ